MHRDHSPQVVASALKDPEFVRQLQRLRQPDNFTNIYYLARAWIYLGLVIGATIWFYQFRQGADISFLWNVPVTLLAVVLVGAGQHQLTGLAHEASHHTLFKNHKLNELVSDLLCMYPLFSTTHQYRLQHLAHHQFVNDPRRDPDLAQMQRSGHLLDFPVSKAEFIKTLLGQIFLPRLVRYMRIRAAYSAVGTGRGPYRRTGASESKVPLLAAVIYLVVLVVLLVSLEIIGNRLMMAVIPAIWCVAMLVFYALLPSSHWVQPRLLHPISPRIGSMLRLGYISGLFAALTWATLLSGTWVAVHFILLWIVPAFTSFSFFMVLRQLVQHGNCDRAALTNTRVFMMSPLVTFSVFPIGQDYHLPHHLFATVPHFRLKSLHELLLAYPDYREEAMVVDGYFRPRQHPPTHPTVLEVLGPEYARSSDDVYIDETVLGTGSVEQKEEIRQEEQLSRLQE